MGSAPLHVQGLAEILSERDDRPHRKLTDREFQVFPRLAQGQSSTEAARDLSRSSTS